ncbi:MAG TPA: leucine-rich repeat domain-containing protein [Verrucomicrobiae bacterium]|jgi:hypothetical protein
MKAKIQNVLLPLLLLLMPAMAQAQFNYTVSNGAATITGYSGPSGPVTIPATIGGYPVTSIGASAFFFNSSPTSITIGTNITSIGDSAFYFCYNLTNVIIGTNVASIGDNAFFASEGVLNFNVPARVSSIGNDAFGGNPYLTNITVAASNPDYISVAGVLFNKNQTTLLQFPSGTFGNVGYGSYAIPASVTSIAEGAFDYATCVTSVTIPNAVTSIGLFAFINCYSLTNVTIPAGVTNFEDAFPGCQSLTNITVAASNPDFSSMAGVVFNKNQTTLVEYPAGLVGACTVPNSVNNIANYGFDNVYYLTSVTIPDTVTNIGVSAFDTCGDLANVTIGNGVTSIGELAFDDCYSLTNVTIGTSVTNISGLAFYSCRSLTGVYFQGNSPTPTNVTSVFSGDNQAIIYYLPGATSWGSSFDGLPTTLWLPQVQASSGTFGVKSNQFGFNISWAGNLTVVVQVATNLANPVWVPISTNTLTGGTSSFSDPLWTNYPGRYYRLSSQ